MPMCQPLPTGEMYWCNMLEYERSDSETQGFVYEVDLHYPAEIQDSTKYYPLCPEKSTVDNSMFSPWQTEHTPRHSE